MTLGTTAGGRSTLGCALVVLPEESGEGMPDAATLRIALQDAGVPVAAVISTSPPPAGEAPDTKVRLTLADLASRGESVVVVAAGEIVDIAVDAAAQERCVRGFALLFEPPCATRDLVDAWTENPVLCVASQQNRQASRDLMDVYLASQHPESEFIWVGGTEESFPPMAASVASWTRRVLDTGVEVREVSFTTEDGWTIFANLVAGVGFTGPRPGVVLLHSGRSDRIALTTLERQLARAGFTVLNIDWRGRGKSVNKGHYFDLSPAERRHGDLDARAALDYLAARPDVDADRLAAVGVVHGAEHVVRAATVDRRVKALVLLTGYMPRDDSERELLTSNEVAVTYVTSLEHGPVTAAMRDLYEKSPNRLARLLVYPGGAIGYQLLELDERLAPTLTSWLAEALGYQVPIARPRSPDLATGTSVAPRPAAESGPGRILMLDAADGWPIGGTLHVPADQRAAVLLVPTATHEQDAYGPVLREEFLRLGVAVLAIDVRGRGASFGPLAYAEMTPRQRLGARLDIAAGVDALRAGFPGPDLPVIVIAEQESAGPALLACADDPSVRALVLLSPRLGPLLGQIPSATDTPTLVLVSREDRRSLRASAGAVLASSHPSSELRLLDGLGIGTTMFSTWQFAHADAQPLEATITAWVDEAIRRGQGELPDGTVTLTTSTRPTGAPSDREASDE